MSRFSAMAAFELISIARESRAFAKKWERARTEASDCIEHLASSFHRGYCMKRGCRSEIGGSLPNEQNVSDSAWSVSRELKMIKMNASPDIRC